MHRLGWVAILLSLTLLACSAHLGGNPGHSHTKVQVNPAQAKVKVK